MNDIRNGVGALGGGGGDNVIPLEIHVWIERFTKLKPLAFRSAVTPAEAEDWITHMEKLFQVLGCPDNFKTRLAAFKLEGDALSWWKAHLRTQVGGDAFADTCTWVAFREIFYNRYFPASEQQRYEREYGSICQLDRENSGEYMERFTRLASFVGTAAGDAQRQARHFKWGLKKWVLDRIVNTEYTNVAQVAAAARNIELLHESGNSNKRDRDGNRIQNRGQGQHEYRGRQDQSVEHRGRQDRGYDSKRQDFRGQDQRFTGRNGNDRQGQGNYNQRQHRGQSTRDFNLVKLQGSASQRSIRPANLLLSYVRLGCDSWHGIGNVRQLNLFITVPPHPLKSSLSSFSAMKARHLDFSWRAKVFWFCYGHILEKNEWIELIPGVNLSQRARIVWPVELKGLKEQLQEMWRMALLDTVFTTMGYTVYIDKKKDVCEHALIKDAHKGDGELRAIVQNVEDGKYAEALREKVMKEASLFSMYYSSRLQPNYGDLKQYFRASGLLSVGDSCMDRVEISMDFVTGLPTTQKRHDAIWVVVDRLTKSAHFLPIRKNYGISKLAEIFRQEIVRLHVVVAKEKLKEARSRQKSYADKHRRDLEFQVGDRVFLKVSPFRGVKRFGIKGKLSP
ncbi:zinc finger, CCHC-type, retrotransposon gag domain protein [Tanacetum coccineum]